MMVRVLGTLLMLAVACHCEEYEIVGEHCDTEFELSDFIDDEVVLVYDGARLPLTCKLTFEQQFSLDRLCVESETFEVIDDFEDVTVQYHRQYYSPNKPDKTYTRHDPPGDGWCTPDKKIVVSFDSTTNKPGDANIRLRVYKGDSNAENIADEMITAAKPVVLIIVIVVASLIVIGAVVAVAVFCYRRRQNHHYTSANPTYMSQYSQQQHQLQHQQQVHGSHQHLHPTTPSHSQAGHQKVIQHRDQPPYQFPPLIHTDLQKTSDAT